jgi:hypothetical protein
MRRFILSSIFLASLATAGTINLTPINDGRGTIGTDANFKVVSGTITTTSTGFADIVLDFNYHPVGSGGPSTPLGQWTLAGVNLNVGDLLFQVGSNDYGIPLASHSGSPDGANPALFANVTAGHFYKSTNELTANTVLNSPGFNFRPNADVWLGASVTDLGTLSETITFNSGQTPSYIVEFTGQLPASFLADVNANGGAVSADFASATCGNGLLVGNGNLGSVPEPTSLLLAGGGLLALGLLRRQRGRMTARQ